MAQLWNFANVQSATYTGISGAVGLSANPPVPDPTAKSGDAYSAPGTLCSGGVLVEYRRRLHRSDHGRHVQYHGGRRAV